MALRFAHGVLSLANGNVEYLLGKLDGIARTFAHKASMRQPPPSAPPKSKLRHYPETGPLDNIPLTSYNWHS